MNSGVAFFKNTTGSVITGVKMFVIGNKTEQYNVDSDSYTTKTQKPTPIYNHAMAYVNNEIVCVGGQKISDNSATSIVEVYNPTTDTWKTSADAGVSDYPSGYIRSRAIVVSGTMYVIAGTDGVAIANKVYKRNTDGSWTELASTPVFMDGHAAVEYGGDIYTFGGTADSNGVYKYDISLNSWSATGDLPDLPKNMSFITGGIINGKVYLVGAGSPQVVEYDLNTATPTTQILDSSYNGVGNYSYPASVTYNDKLYVFNNNTTFRYTHVFDPTATTKWTRLTDMDFSGFGIKAVLVQ